MTAEDKLETHEAREQVRDDKIERLEKEVKGLRTKASEAWAKDLTMTGL